LHALSMKKAHTHTHKTMDTQKKLACIVLKKHTRKHQSWYNISLHALSMKKHTRVCTEVSRVVNFEFAVFILLKGVIKSFISSKKCVRFNM